MANAIVGEFCSKLYILIFEAIGTCMLTCIWQSAYQTYSLFLIFIGFFVVLILSAPISGSHYNPAVTLAFMFRKDVGRFSRMLGLLYIGAQYAGAFVGGVFIYDIMKAYGAAFTGIGVNKDSDGDFYWSQAIFHEALGTMILVFLYLTQTENKYQMA